MKPSETDDLYMRLGIIKTSSLEEITYAYKKLAKKWHPDMNPENLEPAEKEFIAVTEAYEVLSNKEKKQKYDSTGEFDKILEKIMAYDIYEYHSPAKNEEFLNDVLFFILNVGAKSKNRKKLK